MVSILILPYCYLNQIQGDIVLSDLLKNRHGINLDVTVLAREWRKIIDSNHCVCTLYVLMGSRLRELFLFSAEKWLNRQRS